MESNYQISFKSSDLRIKVPGTPEVSNANNLIDEMKYYTSDSIKRMEFDLSNLEYISISGLRLIIYSRQHLNPENGFEVTKSNEIVLDVLNMM